MFSLGGVHLSTFEVELGSLYGKIVFDGGIDALPQWPHFLGTHDIWEKQRREKAKNEKSEHKMVFHRYCVDFIATILQTITVNRRDFSIKVGGY